MLNLIVDPIKSDIVASDTAISLVQGVAFMGAFILFGPFFGRLADAGNRRNIIVGAAVAAADFTVACGFAGGFWGPFLAGAWRGVSQASCSAR